MGISHSQRNCALSFLERPRFSHSRFLFIAGNAHVSDAEDVRYVKSPVCLPMELELDVFRGNVLIYWSRDGAVLCEDVHYTVGNSVMDRCSIMSWMLEDRFWFGGSQCFLVCIECWGVFWFVRNWVDESIALNWSHVFRLKISMIWVFDFSKSV